MRSARALALTLVLAMAASPALAENPMEAFFSCAPWDGATFQFEMDVHHEMTISGTIWLSGLDALEKGQKTVTINNIDTGGDKYESTGHAQICKTNIHSPSCTPDNVTLKFSTLNLQHGGKIDGTVMTSKGKSFPFHTTISDKKVFCG